MTQSEAYLVKNFLFNRHNITSKVKEDREYRRSIFYLVTNELERANKALKEVGLEADIRDK